MQMFRDFLAKKLEKHVLKIGQNRLIFKITG